jgi:hypothetical protein
MFASTAERSLNNDEICEALGKLQGTIQGSGSAPGLKADIAVLKYSVEQLLTLSSETTKSVTMLSSSIAQLTTLVQTLAKQVQTINKNGSNWAQVQLAGMSPDMVSQSGIRKSLINPM